MSNIPRKGFLRNYSLPRVLIQLNRERPTGTLTVTGQGVTRIIILSKGDAIFASSSYEDERLGEVLVKAGTISVQQYDEAVGEMKRTGERLGQVFVKLGHLTPKELFWGVKHQVEEIIYALFQLRDGMYEFGEGAVPDEVITLDLSMANIIYEGVKRISDWTRIKGEMPGQATVFVLSDDPRCLFQNVELAAEDKAVLSLVDGQQAMGSIIEASGLKGFDAMKALYILWSIGLVKEGSGAETFSLSLEDILTPVEDSPEDFVARVSQKHAQLGDGNPHALLEVQEGADREAVSSQYFRLTKEFHPDRYGDSLDPGVRDRISEIFNALTETYLGLSTREWNAGTPQAPAGAGQGGKARGGSGSPPEKTPPRTTAPSPGREKVSELLQKARRMIKGRDYRGAADLLEETVELDPENAECWNYLSLAFSRIPNQRKLAEEAILKAQQLDPGNDDYLTNLGLLYLQAERLDDAKAQFEKALSINPENAKAQKGLSRVFVL
jgi:tetratricopeptide (TPR) repeat protein